MTITRVVLPSLADLRGKILNDIRRLKIRAGVARPNIAPGSESYVKAEAVGATALEIHAKVGALQDATMPDSAEADDLERLASVWKGISKRSGAGATGNVKVQCTGSVTYLSGSEGTTPDGLRYTVVANTVATNGSLVAVRGKDVGKRTNKDYGTAFTWTSPPSGSAVAATVDLGGLTGGTDPDTDATLRARLQDALRHPAAAGSWAHYAQWAEESGAGVEKAFVYPAAQGPATVHVALTRAAIADTYYTRELTAAAINVAALAMVGQSPEHVDLTTTTVADVDTTLVLKLSLPLHKIDGGPGGGWKDALSVRWPSVGTTPYATYLAATPSVANILRITGYTAPVANAQIAVWSNSRKKFVHGKIKSSTLVSGTTYDVTLFAAVDISILASGDYVSPDAEKLDDYGKTVAETFAALGPGELTTNATILPRAYRRPRTFESWPAQYTSRDLGALSNAHPEVAHCSVANTTLPITPAVATLVTDPPNMLVIGKFAVYPL